MNLPVASAGKTALHSHAENNPRVSGISCLNRINPNVEEGEIEGIRSRWSITVVGNKYYDSQGAQLSKAIVDYFNGAALAYTYGMLDGLSYLPDVGLFTSAGKIGMDTYLGLDSQAHAEAFALDVVAANLVLFGSAKAAVKAAEKITEAVTAAKAEAASGNRFKMDLQFFGSKGSGAIEGTSYDINKLYKTQSYANQSKVSGIKREIMEHGPGAVKPIEIRIHNEQALVVEGHHRLEAFRQLGYDRVPIQYIHKSQLGKIQADGTYYRSLQDLLDGVISN